MSLFLHLSALVQTKLIELRVPSLAAAVAQDESKDFN
jgi:hypothetical protein